MQDSLHKIRNVPKVTCSCVDHIVTMNKIALTWLQILKKLAMSQTTMLEWKGLQITLRSLIHLCEMCVQLEKSSGTGVHIVTMMANCANKTLFSINELMERIMDTEKSLERNKFTVNVGIDDELDERRRQHDGNQALLGLYEPFDISHVFIIMT